MADAGLRHPAHVNSIADLEDTLLWAVKIRSNPNHTTTVYQLANVVIEQTTQLMALAKQQLDSCNVGVAS